MSSLNCIQPTSSFSEYERGASAETSSSFSACIKMIEQSPINRLQNNGLNSQFGTMPPVSCPVRLKQTATMQSSDESTYLSSVLNKNNNPYTDLADAPVQKQGGVMLSLFQQNAPFCAPTMPTPSSSSRQVNTENELPPLSHFFAPSSPNSFVSIAPGTSEPAARDAFGLSPQKLNWIQIEAERIHEENEQSADPIMSTPHDASNKPTDLHPPSPTNLNLTIPFSEGPSIHVTTDGLMPVATENHSRYLTSYYLDNQMNCQPDQFSAVQNSLSGARFHENPDSGIQEQQTQPSFHRENLPPPVAGPLTSPPSNTFFSTSQGGLMRTGLNTPPLSFTSEDQNTGNRVISTGPMPLIPQNVPENWNLLMTPGEITLNVAPYAHLSAKQLKQQFNKYAYDKKQAGEQLTDDEQRRATNYARHLRKAGKQPLSQQSEEFQPTKSLTNRKNKSKARSRQIYTLEQIKNPPLSQQARWAKDQACHEQIVSLKGDPTALASVPREVFAAARAHTQRIYMRQKYQERKEKRAAVQIAPGAKLAIRNKSQKPD